MPSASLVRDINPGGPGSAPTDLVSMNGLLFFSADDGIHGRELWSSDPATGVTHLVKDINPGTTGSTPLYLTVVNNVLYFSADDGLRGRELWISNGTTAGTNIVDINPGPASSNPTELTNSNPSQHPRFTDHLYFAANDGQHGRELWRSNGTTASTRLVRDINFGPADSAPTYLTAADVLFTVNGRLRGARRLFFRANDGIHGAELWSTDGSAIGTRLARDIRPGPLGSNPFNITQAGFAVFFGANDGVLGNELWRSNGFALTYLVKDINPGPPSSLAPSPTTLMAQFQGQLFFAADDGFRGRELWRSNGTFLGTQQVKDINPGPASSNPTTQQQPVPNLRSLILNGVLYFGADDGFFGGELWRTDGSNPGTFRVQDINSGTPSGLDGNHLIGAVFNNNIFFAANNGNNVFNIEPWRSNGATLGTLLVQDINTGAAASSPSDFTVVSNALVGNVLFVAADNGLFGRELWRLSAS